MRDEHPGAVRARADQPAGELAALLVEVGVGLVEQQQLGLVEDAAADRQALAHPGRELADPLVGAALHPDRTQRRLDPGLAGLAVDSVQSGVEAEVLAPAQVPVEERLMAEVADPAAQLPGLARQRAPEDLDLAAARPQKGGEDPQQGRLAGPVRAEHEQGLAGAEGQVDTLQGGPFAELVAQAAQLDCRAHPGDCPERAAQRRFLRSVRRPTASSGPAPSRRAAVRSAPLP